MQNALQKTPNIRKMTTFPKWPKLDTMQRLLQNRHFGSKIKTVKHMPKISKKHIRVVLCKKALGKTANIRKNENIFLIAKKIVKNMLQKNSRTTLELFRAKSRSKKQVIFEK